VADNGPGIPPRIRARLFEAFQSDKAEAGNGLGLWICKTIVEKTRRANSLA
jgi:two-component system, NtrC family, sensor kinase